MIRWALALALLAAMAFGTLGWLRVSTDPAQLFGPGFAGLGTLEGGEARRVIIALVSDDRAARTRAARDLAAWLASDPQVAVNIGPAAPDRATLDWLWQHRFRLAPPGDPDARAMAATLTQARDQLAGAAGMALGDLALRDPTGSLAALLTRLAAAAPALPQHDGVWQARDDRAALVFATLAGPFDADATAAWAQAVRARAGMPVILLGARVVSAEVSAATSRAAVWCSTVSLALLLLGTLWVFRSARALACVLVPVALGLAGACLMVQALWGSVHVLALGFGGALMGLAVDYPVHLMTHSGPARRHAGRLMRLGAATTAVAFLALAGAGLPAFAQVGVFVATGLGLTAAASALLIGAGGPAPRRLNFDRLIWTLPRRPLVESALAIGGLALALAASGGPARPMVHLPPGFAQDLAALRPMLDLPSGTHVLRVTGADADQVLTRGAAIRPVLDRAVAEGLLGHYTLLGAWLPDRAAQTAALPAPETFAARAREALALAGLAPGFAPALDAAYAAGVAAPPVTLDQLAAIPALAPLADQIARDGAVWRESGRLYGLSDPQALAARLQAAAVPGVELIDVPGALAQRLAELRSQVLGWLGLGLAAALGLLWALTRAPGLVFGIARTTAAALGLTLGLLSLGGALGVFQIMALTLVVGIGIDYGLFASFARDRAERAAGARSVGLCAASTLVGFGPMALAPAPVLGDIALAVTLGVTAMAALSFATPRAPETARPLPEPA